MTSSLFQALLHPFKSQNVQATLLIPGGLIWAMIMALVAGGVVAWMFIFNADVHPFHGALGVMLLMAIIPLSFVLMGLIGIVLMGYQWRMVAAFQHYGFQGLAPHWHGEEWKQSFMTGLHFTGYAVGILFLIALLQTFLGYATGHTALEEMLYTPTIGDFQLILYEDPERIYPDLTVSMFWIVLWTGIVMVVLAPFLLGPLFYNAQTPKTSALLANLVPSWKWAFSRYFPVIGVSSGCFMGITVATLTIMLLSGLTVVGVIAIPFEFLAAVILLNSLFTKAFGEPPHLIPVENTVTLGSSTYDTAA